MIEEQTGRELDALRGYRIGVLAGGTSSERDISMKSGTAVFNSLKENGVDAEFVDIKEDSSSWLDGLDIDAAFIALHGKFGEDGTVQRMLEEKDIAYTGSGPESSRLALDKIASKRIFSERNLLIPEYRIVRKSGRAASLDDIWIPCVVKPQHEGSSIGLSVVGAPEQLKEALQKAAPYEGDVIIEKYIPGREITVGVVEDRVLPVVEIVTSNICYDYEAKYLADDTRYIVPAELEERVSLRAQEAALEAHRALGCEDLSRVDMRLAGRGDIYVLEVNTIPGLTERSLLPMAARAAGLGFFELCVKVLYNAIRRNERA